MNARLVNSGPLSVSQYSRIDKKQHRPIKKTDHVLIADPVVGRDVDAFIAEIVGDRQSTTTAT